MGNFRTELAGARKELLEVEHGVTIVATGGEELKPAEYLYGEDPRVVTQLDLEEISTERWRQAPAQGSRDDPVRGVSHTKSGRTAAASAARRP